MRLMRFGYKCSSSGVNNVEVVCDRELYEKNLVGKGYVINFSPAEEYIFASRSMSDPARCCEEFACLEKLMSSLQPANVRRVAPRPSHVVPFPSPIDLNKRARTTATEREYWRQSLS